MQYIVKSGCKTCASAADSLLQGTEAFCFEHGRPITVSDFVTKDSGERQEFSTGMVRDTNQGKARYDLIWKPGLKRLAELMGRGAVKYSPRNWEKAETQEELERFKESANRHFEQWFAGDTDEDHMAAVVFNLFGAEMVKSKLVAAANKEMFENFKSDIRQG